MFLFFPLPAAPASADQQTETPFRFVPLQEPTVPERRMRNSDRFRQGYRNAAH